MSTSGGRRERRELGSAVDEQLRLQARAARERVRAGELRGEALSELINAVHWADRDAWVDALLEIEAHVADIPDLPRGAVPYLPCGVDEILAMVAEVPLRPSDELVDLGAGLGRVAILGHLLSGARALGIEIQPPLVERARACGAALSLDGVSFLQADAAETELDGSVFFLYAPFNGAMLARVIDRLAAVAERRRIAVCTVGMELADISWLVARRPAHASLALYDSSNEPSNEPSNDSSNEPSNDSSNEPNNDSSTTRATASTTPTRARPRGS